MALKPADKKIIDAFTDGDPDIPEGAKSDFYASRGTLYGPMGSPLARISARQGLFSVTWIGTGGTKYQDDTYRYLKKTVPSNNFKEAEDTPYRPNGKRKDAFFLWATAGGKNVKLPTSDGKPLSEREATTIASKFDSSRRIIVSTTRDAALPRRTYKDIIHDAEREKYPIDYAVRNGAVDPQALEALKEVVAGLPVA